MDRCVFAEMSPDPNGGQGKHFPWARVVLRVGSMATTLYDFLPPTPRVANIVMAEDLRLGENVTNV